MLNFACPTCGFTKTVADELAGRSVICPKCRTKSRLDSIAIIDNVPECVSKPPQPTAQVPAAGREKIYFEMAGVQDILRIYKNKLSIEPMGVLGFLNKGLKGTKEIPYRSIVAIQIKEAGAMFNGFLQFTIPGGNESKGGLFAATNDENSFVFSGLHNNSLVNQIKGFIQWEIEYLHKPPQSTTSLQPSISEELLRLALLQEQGVLSDEEFALLKRRIIG
jgi:hypothetical protein